MGYKISVEKVRESRISEIDFNDLPFGKHFSDHMFIADDVPHGAPALGDFVHDDMIHEDLEAVDVADEDLEAVDVADEEQ